MKEQRTSLRKRVTKGLAGLAYAGIVMATPFIGGCATLRGYGDLNGSREVTKNFERGGVKSDHNYFRAGAKKDSPNAILGLDNQYTLDNTKFWHPVEPKSLQKLVEKMKDDSENTAYGADVIGPNGEDMGDFYSTANRTTVRLKDGKRVIIYAPMMSGAGGSGSTSTGSTGGGSSGGGSGSGGGSSG